MRLILRYVTCLWLVALLAACGKSPENPAPAAATAPVAVSAAAPAASTAPAPSAAPATASAAPTTSAPVATTIASATAVTLVPAATAAVSPGTTAAPAAASSPEIAGSVALAEGSVTDTAKDGSVRQLKDGDEVYPGDSFVLGDASYLDLDLEDTGRILLRPNTTFEIVSYHYEPDAHQASAPTDAQGQPLIKPQQPENSFFKLIKGGLRAIDGDIGHTSPQNYGVETPVATIGVRGTAFDVRYCGDDCADEADASGKPDNGLYTSVSEGSVGIKNDSGETVTHAGQSGFVKSRKEKFKALSTPPKALRHMGLPDKLKARAQKNRGQIQVRRQQRRQQVLERRHQAAQKDKQPVQIPQERRELRQEEKRGGPQHAPTDRHEREQHREQGQQKQTAVPESGKPAAVGQGSAQGERLTPRERWQQQRQERLQQREQKQQRQAAHPAAKAGRQPAAKENKQGEGRCGGKRKKDKKCGG